MYVLLFIMVLTGLFSMWNGMGMSKAVQNGLHDGKRDGKLDGYKIKKSERSI